MENGNVCVPSISKACLSPLTLAKCSYNQKQDTSFLCKKKDPPNTDFTQGLTFSQLDDTIVLSGVHCFREDFSGASPG